MADYNIWDTAVTYGTACDAIYTKQLLKQAREQLRKEQQELAKFDEYDQSEEGAENGR